MWFLRTDRAELVYHSGPEGIVYATLSHVWGPSEQSFQDLQTLHALYGSSSTDNPRTHACAKIRNFCIYAEAAGYEWAWIDTCCIDKTSSAELSEAINSMYAWYADADVCYAFLEDVPDDDDPDAPGSAFRRSKWFTRGWTLQELIAPMDVVFLSQNWAPLCSKCAAPGLIRDVTGVDIDVLVSAVQLPSVPAAKRLSWASRRETTRVEDEAYSLMGIFGVNIPVMYGEGRRAFRRLQEEIMKQSPDHTLFVWGFRKSVTVSELWEHAPWTNYPRKAVHAEADPSSQFLLAPSPQAFTDSAHIQSLSIRRHRIAAEISLAAFNLTQPEASSLNKVLFSQQEVAEFTVTSYGVRARLPVLQICDDDTSIAIAILACVDQEGSIVGLLLRQQEDVGGISLFRVGVHAIYHDIHRPYPLYHSARYVRIHLTVPENSAPPVDSARRFTLTWREVYLVYHPHSFGFADLRGIAAPVAARPLLSPCRLFFPPYMLARLARRGFVPDRALSIHQHGPGRQDDPFDVMFTNALTQEAFNVRVASCLRPAMSLPNANGHGKGTHAHQPFRHLWATVEASWPARDSEVRTSPGSESDWAGAGVGAYLDGVVAAKEARRSLDRARRCYWCRETHLDQWEELDAQSGKTGRQTVFAFVGNSVRLTFSHWDARSRATDAEAGGGGLYAVNVVVEEEIGGDRTQRGGGEELKGSRRQQNGVGSRAGTKASNAKAKRSSSRSSVVRSMLAAVHQQVLGKR
ncbi:heterokaryon incompatibility protein-domain-containing protein [Daedaleopsis nitida]|nr:heterokaryon incompatibility protein-domain-containing protein [Daedaleopsis nitida]